MKAKNSPGNKHGQSSVEFLIIFSVVIVAFMIFFTLVLQQGVDVSRKKIGIDATNTVNELDSAARSVYLQGEGAKKKVFITMPDGFERNASSISGNLIKMRVSGSDFAVTEPFDVYGSFPTTPGKHWVWVISEGARVRIGTAMIATDRETINTLMTNNNSRNEVFNVFNIWNETVNVTINKEWNNPNVSFGLSDYSFSFLPGAKRTITASFGSSSVSNGFYTGNLNLTGSDAAGNSDSLNVPVSIEVSAERGLGPPLNVYPSIFQASMNPGTTTSKSFEVCTNINTSLDQVTFSPSVGAPGTWVVAIAPLVNMDAATCQTKSISVSVPSNASLGNFSGFIYVTGNNTPEAEDSIALAITVGGSTTDTQGPIVRNITIFPKRKKFVLDPITVLAVADDSTTGNNTIAGCDVRVDGGPWYAMGLVNPELSRPKKDASYTYFSGFTLGNHVAGVKCTDVKNNTGAEVNATFKIYKEFLFITANASPNAYENAWLNWIALDLSQEGFAWGTDRATATDFIAGSPNLTYYSTIITEEWVTGMQTRLNSFVSSNGSIIILGNALTNGPNALVGCSGSSNDPVNQTQVKIESNSHYITQNLTTGNIVVGTVSQQHGRFWKNCNMNPVLARSYDDPTHYDEMGIAGNRYFWGPVTPNNLSETGINITVRTLDFALNASRN